MQCVLSWLSVLSLFLSVSAHDNIHYVVSHEEASGRSCPNSSCLTLEEYLQEAETYFTTGTTFIILTGNYSLEGVINLANISNITLRGEKNGSIINIINGTIRCQNVTGLNIERLTFSVYSSTISSVLKIIKSNKVFITSCIFRGTGNLNIALVRALLVRQTMSPFPVLS